MESEIQELAGKQRPVPNSERIAARIEKARERFGPDVPAENVQRLNPGYFEMARMRAAAPKARAIVRTAHKREV